MAFCMTTREGSRQTVPSTSLTHASGQTGLPLPPRHRHHGHHSIQSGQLRAQRKWQLFHLLRVSLSSPISPGAGHLELFCKMDGTTGPSVCTRLLCSHIVLAKPKPNPQLGNNLVPRAAETTYFPVPAALTHP